MSDGAARAPRETVRRVLHVASGALGLWGLWLPASGQRYVLTAVFLLAVLLELVRLGVPWARRRVHRLAGPFFRPDEAAAVSGATTLALGYALACWCFPGVGAAQAIIVSAIADPVAAAVGSRLGRPAGKSGPGSLACAASAAGTLLVLGVSPLPAAGAGLAAALAERAPWRGGDNVAMPVLTAAVLAVLR